MSIPMTPEDALSTLAKAAEALGPPFETNPLAMAGRVLYEEIERLHELVKPLEATGVYTVPAGHTLRVSLPISIEVDPDAACGTIILATEEALRDGRRAPPSTSDTVRRRTQPGDGHED